MNILIINGPNLNMLGTREPEIYGHETLMDIMDQLQQKFPAVGIRHFQSNHEGALLDRIQESMNEEIDGIVINGGALTHYSYALADALSMLKVPRVEVHISHIFAREPFRHKSVIAPVCDGMISGMGTKGYELAVAFLVGE